MVWTCSGFPIRNKSDSLSFSLHVPVKWWRTAHDGYVETTAEIVFRSGVRIGTDRVNIGYRKDPPSALRESFPENPICTFGR